MKSTEVELGSIVRIRSSTDEQSYMIVKSQDADPFTYRISIDSPLGKTLLHKHKNDLVRIKSRWGNQTYIIDEVIPIKTQA